MAEWITSQKGTHMKNLVTVELLGLLTRRVKYKLSCSANNFLLMLFWTRKRGNCECIATWGSSTPRSPYTLQYRRPCQVWSRSTFPLASYSVFTAHTLRYSVTWNFDPMTYTVDLWPRTFVVCRLCRSQSLCKKLLSLKRSVIGDISQAFKTAKISVFDPMMCKRPDVPLHDELLCWSFVVYVICDQLELISLSVQQCKYKVLKIGWFSVG